jgi:hypothetical protein
LLFDTADE